jgi:hypothetical protein
LEYIKTEWLEAAQQTGRRIDSASITLASESTTHVTGTFGTAIVVTVPGKELIASP